MANKKILLGMLAVLLVFGASLVGCEYGDPGLEGSWKMTASYTNYSNKLVTTVSTFTFTSGDVEYKTVTTGGGDNEDGTRIIKGTYVASNGMLGMTFTYHSFNSVQISPFNQSSSHDYVIYGSTLILDSYGAFTKE
jgi:hypothetical protein